MNRVAWVLTLLFVVMVVAIIFLLGDEDGPGGATTIEQSTPTLADTTTTTIPKTTVTAVGDTTTSVGDTTTSSALEGNWAPQPLVVAEFGALGWWDGSAWVQVDQGTALPVRGGEDYRVAYLGVEATVTGGAPTILCEPLQNPGVELANPLLLGDPPGPVGVAVSAPWELTPHLVEPATDDDTYTAIAADLLAGRGLPVPDPVIKQLLRVDLEGDGINEVVVVTEDIAPGFLAREGDYSVLLMRKVVGGEVVTTVLEESLVTGVPEGESPIIYSFAVGAVADLSGDGKMEIVISTVYYEGIGVGVWEYVNDDLGLVVQIQQGCGA